MLCTPAWILHQWTIDHAGSLLQHGVHSSGPPRHIAILCFHPVSSTTYGTNWPVLWGISGGILWQSGLQLWTSCHPFKHDHDMCSVLLYTEPTPMLCLCRGSGLLLGVWRRHSYSWRPDCSNCFLVGFWWVSNIGHMFSWVRLEYAVVWSCHRHSIHLVYPHRK